MWSVTGQSRIMHRDRHASSNENRPDLDRVRWRAAGVHDGVGDQFAGHQDGVIARRAKVGDLAKCRPNDGRGSPAAPNLQHQQRMLR